MKKVFLYLLLFPAISTSQTGITFKVEELSKPKNLLDERHYEDILKERILDAAFINDHNREKQKANFEYNIIAKSKQKSKLVDFGNNPFFNGLHRAYADHRPFVLSPDMIWLLITQGFARHVNSNPEELRKEFVDFDGKASLIVEEKDLDLKNPDGEWEEVFSHWNTEIASNAKGNLVKTLAADFTTTTPISKAVSQVTIMESMKSYFEFLVFYQGCGIPQITLEGTPQDWQKVLAKAQALKRYKLEWWIGELEPILKEFVRTSQHKPDIEFWRSMFKEHEKGTCGAPTLVDGWAVKFFPYDRDGKRLQLKQLALGGKNLSAEMVRVDVKHFEVTPNGDKETPLEVWAGFTGLSQDPETFALRPEMGWMVRKRDNDNAVIASRLNDAGGQLGDDIRIRVTEVPEAILKIESLNRFAIDFIDSIKIPDRMKELTIGSLKLTGRVSEKEINRITKMFPAGVLINGRRYSKELLALQGSSVDVYKPIEGVKFDKLSVRGDDGHYYSLYNQNSFWKGFEANNAEGLIRIWNSEHPGAKVYPITTSSMYSNNLVVRGYTYCRVIAGKDTLNNYLVKKGALPALFMERQKFFGGYFMEDVPVSNGLEWSENFVSEGSQRFKFLISNKNFRTYLKQIYAAEKYAKANKLGIYAETESK